MLVRAKPQFRIAEKVKAIEGVKEAFLKLWGDLI